MTTPQPVRRHLYVAGRVQAVGFRAACRGQAVARGLSGFVRNLPDGRVEAAFEGEPDAVGSLVDWCRRGPAGALVTGVEVLEEEPAGARGFRVLA